MRSKTDQLCPSDRFDIIEEFHSYDPMSSILGADFLALRSESNETGDVISVMKESKYPALSYGTDQIWIQCGTALAERDVEHVEQIAEKVGPRGRNGKTGANRPCHFRSQMNM